MRRTAVYGGRPPATGHPALVAECPTEGRGPKKIFRFYALLLISHIFFFGRPSCLRAPQAAPHTGTI